MMSRNKSILLLLVAVFAFAMGKINDNNLIAQSCHQSALQRMILSPRPLDRPSLRHLSQITAIYSEPSPKNLFLHKMEPKQPLKVSQKNNHLSGSESSSQSYSFSQSWLSSDSMREKKRTPSFTQSSCTQKTQTETERD